MHANKSRSAARNTGTQGVMVFESNESLLAMEVERGVERERERERESLLSEKIKRQTEVWDEDRCQWAK